MLLAMTSTARMSPIVRDNGRLFAPVGENAVTRLADDLSRGDGQASSRRQDLSGKTTSSLTTTGPAISTSFALAVMSLEAQPAVPFGSLSTGADAAAPENDVLVSRAVSAYFTSN